MDINGDNDGDSVQDRLRDSKLKDYLPMQNQSVSEKFISRNEAVKVFQKFDWNMALLIDHVYLDCELPSPGKDEGSSGIRVSRMKPEVKLADPLEVRKVMFK